MNDWPDVVTTALLGTSRRPLPTALPPTWSGISTDGADGADGADRDPAVAVLALAARHRAAVRAGPVAPVGPAADAQPTAPAEDRASPPPAAVEILGDLLVRPTPDLINFWLTEAEESGCGIPSALWTRMARLAAHSTAYDRPVLGRVLGARGRWFLGLNPEWRRLAADCSPAEPGTVRGSAEAQRVAVSSETVRGRPMMIFNHPDPWPDEIVAAAFSVVGTLALGRKARDFAGRVGARLPMARYPSIAAAAEYYLSAPDATPAQRRMIKESFVIMEQTAFARVQIERSFSPAAAAQTRRVEIPRV